MKPLICTVITIVLQYVADLSAQETTVVTYTTKSTEQLNCELLSSSNFAQWTERVGSTDVTIYEYIRGTGITKPNAGYENFSLDNGTATSFHLVIENVRKGNGGDYTCVPAGGTILEYMVIVEVIPSSMDINNNGNELVNANENYTFTCTAVGVVSPNVLSLTWSINNVISMPATTRTPNGNDSDLKDLSSQFTFMPQKDDTFIKCSVTEYVNQEEINEDFISETLQLNVQYAPICSLEVTNGEVGDNGCTVMLTCLCDAKPQVTTGDYSYFNGNADIEGDGGTTTSDVGLETTAEFSCSGSNTVGTGEKSAPVPYTCTTSTTSSTTTTERAPPPTTTEGVNAAAVAGGVVGGVAVVVLVIVIVYIVKKRGFCEKCTDEKNAVTATTGDTSSAPVYGVIDKSKKKKSDKTDGNGMQMSDAPEYAAVSKPLNSEPKPAPRSSQPPPTNSTEKELQYADIDHSNRTPSNQIRQPAEAPTEYATVKSVIV